MNLLATCAPITFAALSLCPKLFPLTGLDAQETKSFQPYCRNQHAHVTFFDALNTYAFFKTAQEGFKTLRGYRQQVGVDMRDEDEHTFSPPKHQEPRLE